MNLYRKEARELFLERNPYIELLQTLNCQELTNTSHINRSLYLWAKTNLPEVILSFLGDRMEMANSVEGRLPFLDHRLAEFAQRLPIHLKINGLTEKYILREAMKSLIPDSIYRRQKHPFTAPPLIGSEGSSKTEMHKLIENYFHSQFFEKIPFYDQKKFIALLERLPTLPTAQRTAADPLLNRALSACMMVEHFGL